MTISNGESGSSVRAKINLNLSETVNVTISNAEILALFSSPKTIIAAPGLGKAIAIEDFTYEYAFNTIQFAVVGGAALQYASLGLDIDGGLVKSFITSTSSQIGMNIPPGADVSSLARSSVENKAVLIKSASNNPTGGNGTVYITARYRTYTFQG